MEAKSAALTGPPPLLERIVLLCIPPAARETVGGDLCEMYRSPLQYGSQALRTLPFVIASQIRRNANLPLLLLQGFIVFACFGGFFAATGLGQGGWPNAAPVTAMALLFLVLYDVYQQPERPSSRRAIFETILLAGCVMLFFPQALLGLVAVQQLHGFWWPGFALLGCFFVIVPVLCCLRAGLILEIDRRYSFTLGEMSAEDVPRDYAGFRQRSIWRNQVESGALIAAAALFVWAGHKISPPFTMASLVMVGGYGVAALYLLLDGAVRLVPAEADFLSLCALYQYELARQHQLRRFLWWLWCAPLFLLLYLGLIGRGITDGKPLLVTLGIMAALLLGFFIGALNRERSGPIQEKIMLLGSLQIHRSR